MKILICFLFVLITSCRTIELPYSSCCDLVPKWRECIEVKVTNNKIYLGSDKINNYSSIYDWINRYRATYKEGVNLYANMYIDKNCLYSRVDSIIEQLRKSYILRFHIKTNSLKDSCFVDISFLPLGAYCDSLENELISKTPLEKESINLFLVSDYKDDSYIVNNRVMNKLDLRYKLNQVIQESVKCIFVIIPNTSTNFSDVIELTDLYNSVLYKKRNDYALRIYGRTYFELDSEIKKNVNYFYKKTFGIINKRLFTNKIY